jgi:hypothetical protein
LLSYNFANCLTLRFRLDCDIQSKEGATILGFGMLQMFQGSVSMFQFKGLEWGSGRPASARCRHVATAYADAGPTGQATRVPQVRHDATSSPPPLFPFPLLYHASRGGQREPPLPPWLHRARTPSSSRLGSIHPSQSSAVSSTFPTS